MSSANTKRMALSSDQRAVLEAVYAVDKLPDTALRDRLSSYLELSTRQIQVWFQNRRQRAKASGGPLSPRRKGIGVLSTPDQIMSALFDFSGSLTGDEADYFAFASAYGGADGVDDVVVDGVVDDDDAEPPLAVGPYSPSTDGRGSSRCLSDGAVATPTLGGPAESFDFEMPPLALPPLCALPPPFAPSRHPVPRRAVPPAAPPTPAAPAAGEAPPAPEGRTDLRTEGEAAAVLGAVLSFACHELRLEAAEFWRLPADAADGGVPPPPRPVACTSSTLGSVPELACSRAMLGVPLVQAVVRAREPAWFGGASAGQRDVMARSGVALRTLVAVPCFEPATEHAAAAVSGALLLYTRAELRPTEPLGMLLHALGGAAFAAAVVDAQAAPPPAAAYTAAAAAQPEPEAGMARLLDAAARSLQFDIAEHWSARPQPGGGVSMRPESVLVSSRLAGLPDVVTATGTEAAALHPFSSHMARASLYAAKLVWCHATAANGVLEGIRLPMQTAVGIPLRSGASVAVFVLFSMRRLEQPAAVGALLTQLQLLAAAAANHAAPQAGRPPPLLASPVGSFAAGRHAAAAAERAVHAAAAVHAVHAAAAGLDAPAPRAAASAGPSMSTDQVMQLLDCLGDDGPQLLPRVMSSENTSATTEPAGTDGNGTDGNGTDGNGSDGSRHDERDGERESPELAPHAALSLASTPMAPAPMLCADAAEP